MLFFWGFFFEQASAKHKQVASDTKELFFYDQMEICLFSQASVNYIGKEAFLFMQFSSILFKRPNVPYVISLTVFPQIL